ncbi:MAG TPA: sigma-70 family RNA polymerase sigma factor [Anaerolineaceae bacterium]|mgnify:CR=1 FL=1|nr:sigma-70 family RNA polymerase sigma factor [Anaerolineaceae bacterium]HPN52091.1 sigma-70 family RNA polymerase sigma factor [Anaerolineaceae bacterium]
MITEQETKLVQRARLGDAQAFGELVLMHQTFVYNLALRGCGDPQEAQDLAQEAFLKAWQALPGFRQEARFSTWLYKIVINQCYNRRPRLKREMEALPVDEAAESLPLPGEGANPAHLFEKNELRALLQQKIQQLTPAQRLLVQLRYQQELSYEEIAEITAMPLGSVKTGLFRTHAALRAALVMAGRLQEEVYA